MRHNIWRCAASQPMTSELQSNKGIQGSHLPPPPQKQGGARLCSWAKKTWENRGATTLTCWWPGRGARRRPGSARHPACCPDPTPPAGKHAAPPQQPGSRSSPARQVDAKQVVVFCIHGPCVQTAWLAEQGGVEPPTCGTGLLAAIGRRCQVLSAARNAQASLVASLCLESDSRYLQVSRVRVQ